jgi:hypothetical protein
MLKVNAFYGELVIKVIVMVACILVGISTAKAESCKKDSEMISIMKEISAKLDNDSCNIKDGKVSVVFPRSLTGDLKDHSYQIVTKLRACCGGVIFSDSITLIDSDNDQLTIQAKCK